MSKENLILNYCKFNTQIGVCGIVWDDNFVRALFLPEKSETKLENKLKLISQEISSQKKKSSIPPFWIKEIVEKLKLHFKGDLQDFSKVPIFFENVSDFTKLVYKEIKKEPAGKVLTYKDLAKKIGRPNASRAVGTALGKNKILVIIPCHRVIASSGGLGGFSASGGVSMKKKLLEIEGVK